MSPKKTFLSHVGDVAKDFITVMSETKSVIERCPTEEADSEADSDADHPHDSLHYFAMEVLSTFYADVMVIFSVASGAIAKAVSVSRLMALVACLTLGAGAGPSTHADLIQQPVHTVIEKVRDSKSAGINYMWVLFAGFVASCTCNCLILVHWCRKRKRSHQETSKIDDMLVECYLQTMNMAELICIAEAVGYKLDSSRLTKKLLMQMIMARATQAHKEEFKANGLVIASGAAKKTD